MERTFQIELSCAIQWVAKRRRLRSLGAGTFILVEGIVRHSTSVVDGVQGHAWAQDELWGRGGGGEDCLVFDFPHW